MSLTGTSAKHCCTWPAVAALDALFFYGRVHRFGTHSIHLLSMAAQIPCFEYDIFISYRHNDKKWMAEFMPQLEGALTTISGRKLNTSRD